MQQLRMFATPPRGREELSQWCTPPELASRLVRWAGIAKGATCLEPSCGTGNFVQALIARGCYVIANDIDETMSQYVASSYGHSRFFNRAWQDDFLTGTGWETCKADWVVLNPPYEHGQDRAHVNRACRIAPKVLTLIRTAALHGIDAQARVWSKHRVRKIGLLVKRPRFLLGDTVQGGPRHDFCAVVFDRYCRAQPVVEWLL